MLLSSCATSKAPPSKSFYRQYKLALHPPIGKPDYKKARFYLEAIATDNQTSSRSRTLAKSLLAMHLLTGKLGTIDVKGFNYWISAIPDEDKKTLDTSILSTIKLVNLYKKNYPKYSEKLNQIYMKGKELCENNISLPENISSQDPDNPGYYFYVRDCIMENLWVSDLAKQLYALNLKILPYKKYSIQKAKGYLLWSNHPKNIKALNKTQQINVLMAKYETLMNSLEIESVPAKLYLIFDSQQYQRINQYYQNILKSSGAVITFENKKLLQWAKQFESTSSQYLAVQYIVCKSVIFVDDYESVQKLINQLVESNNLSIAQKNYLLKLSIFTYLDHKKPLQAQKQLQKLVKINSQQLMRLQSIKTAQRIH